MTKAKPSAIGMVAATLTLALVGCSDDDGNDKASGKKDSGDQPAAQSTAQPSAQPSSGAGLTLDGDGYTVALPKGWEDSLHTDEGEVTAEDPDFENLDVAAQLMTGSDRGASIMIEKQPANGASNPTDSDWQSHITQTQGKKVDIDPITLDGSQALGMQSFSTTEADHHVTYHEFVTIHDDAVYSITYTAIANYETSITKTLNLIENSWTWE